MYEWNFMSILSKNMIIFFPHSECSNLSMQFVILFFHRLNKFSTLRYRTAHVNLINLLSRSEEIRLPIICSCTLAYFIWNLFDFTQKTVEIISLLHNRFSYDIPLLIYSREFHLDFIDIYCKWRCE